MALSYLGAYLSANRVMAASAAARFGFAFELGEGDLRGAVYGHEKIELSLLGSDLGDVDVEEADRIGLELLLVRLVALDLRQPADPRAMRKSG